VTFLIAVVSIVQGMNVYMTDTFAGALVGVNTFQLRQRPNFNNVPDAPNNGVYRSDTGAPDSFTKVGGGYPASDVAGRAEFGVSDGPGQDSTKLIPYVTHALLGGERPRLGSGDRLLDWVYAGDVAQAYLAAATVAGVEGRTLDVGGPFRATVREVVGAIVEQLGLDAAEPLFGDVAARPLEQEVEPDLEATAAALGWRATTELDAGLRHTVGWIRARHLLAAGARPQGVGVSSTSGSSVAAAASTLRSALASART